MPKEETFENTSASSLNQFQESFEKKADYTRLRDATYRYVNTPLRYE
jgi:hypothetical protein